MKLYLFYWKSKTKWKFSTHKHNISNCNYFFLRKTQNECRWVTFLKEIFFADWIEKVHSVFILIFNFFSFLWLAVQGSYIANNYHPIAGKYGQVWASLDKSGHVSDCKQVTETKLYSFLSLQLLMDHQRQIILYHLYHNNEYR